MSGNSCPSFLPSLQHTSSFTALLLILCVPASSQADSYSCTGEYNCQSISGAAQTKMPLSSAARSNKEDKGNGENEGSGIGGCFYHGGFCTYASQCKADDGVVTGRDDCAKGYICCLID